MKLRALVNVNACGKIEQKTPPEYTIQVFNVEGAPVLSEEVALGDFNIKDIDTIILNLPVEILNFRILLLPALEERKLREIIPFEMENQVLIKREDMIFDFVTENREDGRIDALVVYLDKRDFKSIINPLSERGILISSATSIDVMAALSQGIKGFAENLLNPRKLSPEERLELQYKEVMSPSLKFTDSELKSEGIRKDYLKPLIKTTTLLLVLLMTLLLWFALGAFMADREAKALKRELRDSYTTLFPRDIKVKDEVYQIKSQIKGLRERAESLIGIRSIDILSRLAGSKVAGITIVEISIEKETLKLKGESPTVEAIEGYKKRLSWIQNPEVSNVTQGERGVYSFTVAGRLKIES